MAAKSPRIAACVCWLHHTGAVSRRASPQQSNRDSGEAWSLLSSATLADTSDGMRSGSSTGDDLAANCRMMGSCSVSRHGAQSCISLLDKLPRGTCFDRRRMGGRDETPYDMWVPGQCERRDELVIKAPDRWVREGWLIKE